MRILLANCRAYIIHIEMADTNTQCDKCSQKMKKKMNSDRKCFFRGKNVELCSIIEANRVKPATFLALNSIWKSLTSYRTILPNLVRGMIIGGQVRAKVYFVHIVGIFVVKLIKKLNCSYSFYSEVGWSRPFFVSMTKPPLAKSTHAF